LIKSRLKGRKEKGRRGEGIDVDGTVC